MLCHCKDSTPHNGSRADSRWYMTPEEMRTLYDFNAWANRRSLSAVAKLTPEQFIKPMGSSFSSVRDTLAHIFGAEWVWLERFQGRSPSALPNVSLFSDVRTLRETWSVHEEQLLVFVAGLTRADLDRKME